MKRFISISLFLLGCAHHELPSNHTAYEQYSALNGHDKATAGNFYGLGKADEIKSLYWAQRSLQERPSVSDTGPVLQRRYVNIPVPEHVEPDGTVKEASLHAVEIVQFWTVVKQNGTKLHIAR
jgi:hypothetical protein